MRVPAPLRRPVKFTKKRMVCPRAHAIASRVKRKTAAVEVISTKTAKVKYARKHSSVINVSQAIQFNRRFPTYELRCNGLTYSQKDGIRWFKRRANGVAKKVYIQHHYMFKKRGLVGWGFLQQRHKSWSSIK